MIFQQSLVMFGNDVLFLDKSNLLKNQSLLAFVTDDEESDDSTAEAPYPVLETCI